MSGFSFSAIAIRRHIGTLMLSLALIVVGVFYLTQIQVDLLPSITYPRIGLRVNAPGVSPEVAVEEITKPLEEAFSATEGVVQIYSQTREGQVSLDLFFQPGGDIEQALNDATASFNRAQGRLPDIIESPRLFKFDPSQQPVYEFALTSTELQDVELRVFADEELARELGVVPGVASVDVSGGVQEEVRVNIDLNRLQAQGVGLTDVLNALSDRNQDISGGRIRGDNAEPLTRTVGKFKDASEIENLSFEVSSDTPSLSSSRVYLRDFAEVIDGVEDRRVFVSLNGEAAVKLSIQKQPDANTIAVVDGVTKRLEELRQSGLISPEMTFIPTLDESRFIRNSLNDVTSSAISGALLAAVAVLFFLGSLRQTLIISLTIPLCTLSAIVAMKLFGFSLNLFSLAGLALGIGQAIDTSVVILENITVGVTNNPALRNRKTKDRGKKVIEESIDRSLEVESSMIASTGANLVSVLPFLLIGGFFSLLFSELILTICFAVMASLLVALSVTPMLMSRLMAISWSSRIGEFFLIRQFNRSFEAATRSYSWVLAGAMRWRLIVVAIAFTVLGGGSIVLAGQIPQEILPRINTGQANLNAQFPPGTPLETNLKIMGMVDEILLKQPETEYVFTTAGGSLFGSNTTSNPLRASSTITFKKGVDVAAFVSPCPQPEKSCVSKELDNLNLAGIRLRLSPGQVRGIILTNSPARGADIDIILQGDDEQTLQQAGRQVLNALDEEVKLASFRPEADAKQPEVQIRPDWERLSALGLTTKDVGETIQTAIEGSVPTQLQRGARLVDVRVQLDRESISRPSQISQLPIFFNSNRQVRLGDVATIEEGQAPGEIQRINQRQVFIIAGSLNKEKRASFSEVIQQLFQNQISLSEAQNQLFPKEAQVSLSDALKQVDEVVSKIELPEGVSILPSSARQTNQELQNSLKLLGGLAAFLVFIVMAVQYNSLIDPLVIIFTVPLALAGGIVGLYVTQTAIGATVLVGAVLLVGIVVNIGIIMVEQANQIREEESCDRQTAILKAAPQRLRPIMMTTVTTILGLFPLALGLGEGSEFLQPLGVVVFSGMSIATFLTLFIIPCLYVLLHEIGFKRFGKRFKARKRLRLSKKKVRKQVTETIEGAIEEAIEETKELPQDTREVAQATRKVKQDK